MDNSVCHLSKAEEQDSPIVSPESIEDFLDLELLIRIKPFPNENP